MTEIDFISKMTEWGFYIFVFVTSIIIFPRLNIMLWLALFFSLTFCIPVRHRAWEYNFRVFCLYLSSILWILGLTIEAGNAAAIYIATLLVITSVITCILFSHIKWYIPHLSADIYQLILILTFIAGLAISPVTETGAQKYHIIGSFSVVLLVLMLGGAGVAARRSRIVRCVGDVKRFREKLESMYKKQEAKLVSIRFEEFLKHVDAGALGYAYVTLSTGLLEIIGIWKDKKRKFPEFDGKKFPYTHDEIRGAIVHSLPRPEKRKITDKDAARRLEIYNQFRRCPFVAICDLLIATKRKFEKSYSCQT